MSDENGLKKKGSHLTHEQFYQLVQWVASNGERLMKEKPTYKEAARQAAAALGVEGVSEDASLKKAMKLAGIEWESACAGGRTYARIKPADYEALKTRLKQSEADVAVLRGLIHHLYTEIGAKPPAGYVIPQAVYAPTSMQRISDGGR